MKKSIANKWVKALRSGTYTQGKTFLKNQGNYCCLGVLCEISKLGTWDKDGIHYNSKGEWEACRLPKPVQMWAGMKHPSGNNLEEPLYSLTFMNDSLKLSFNEIASIIEKRWKEL